MNTLAVFGSGYVQNNLGVGVVSPGHKIDVSGGNARVAGEVISTMGSGYGQLRMISGNYGAFWRNDGANTYFLLTASGDQYGSWNTLRPFYVNNASGAVTIATSLTVSGNVTAPGFFHSSDARLKEQVATLPGLSIVEKLRGVSFIWKKDGTPSAGVIAQEVEAVMPSAVHTDVNGMKSVDYDQLVGALIEAIKEQETKIDAQSAQITSLTHELETLKASR